MIIRGNGLRPRSRWCWPAISTSFPRPRTSIIRPPGPTTRCSARDPRKLPVPAWPWPDRCAARGHRRARPVHLLGLSGRRLAEELGHPDRPSAAVAAGQRPADQCRHRQLCPRLGEAVGPCAGLGGFRSRGGVDVAGLPPPRITDDHRSAWTSDIPRASRTFRPAGRRRGNRVRDRNDGPSRC